MRFCRDFAFARRGDLALRHQLLHFVLQQHVLIFQFINRAVPRIILIILRDVEQIKQFTLRFTSLYRRNTRQPRQSRIVHNCLDCSNVHVSGAFVSDALLRARIMQGVGQVLQQGRGCARQARESYRHQPHEADRSASDLRSTVIRRDVRPSAAFAAFATTFRTALATLRLTRCVGCSATGIRSVLAFLRELSRHPSGTLTVYMISQQEFAFLAIAISFEISRRVKERTIRL